MKETDAVLLGLGAASVVPVALIWVVSPITADHDIGSVLSAFAIFYPFSVMATLLLGAPTFLLLRPFGPGHWWSALLVGCVVGIAVAIILRLPGPPQPRDFIPYGPIGAVSALVFWLIWRRFTTKTE